MSIKILDCTLRDGGYVNNWDFSTNQIDYIINNLVKSGIETIEIGILGKHNKEGGTKYNDFAEIERLNLPCLLNVKYALMVNYAEASDFFIPKKNETNIDIIRIAFFKNEANEAIKYAEAIKSKGYEVFMQPMATSLYSERELQLLLNKINSLEPAAFYMVDSFGTMFNDDVKRISSLIISHLSETIQFGFHAHNNMQMALSNVIFLSSFIKTRDIYIDSTVFGMGRGAGNVPTEILQFFLNQHGYNYDYVETIKVFETVLNPIFQHSPWGYSMMYFISASMNTNSAYSWYFNNKGLTSYMDQIEVLKKIPDNKRYTLMKDIADDILLNKDKNHD